MSWVLRHDAVNDANYGYNSSIVLHHFAIAVRILACPPDHWKKLLSCISLVLIIASYGIQIETR